MKFGKQFLLSRRKRWQSSYVDYESLKTIIKVSSTSPESGKGLSVEDLFKLLNIEVEKSNDFYVATVTAFGQKLSALRARSEEGSDEGTKATVYDDLQSLRKDLEELREFVTLNLTAVRKILKKYDRWNTTTPAAVLNFSCEDDSSSSTSPSAPSTPSRRLEQALTRIEEEELLMVDVNTASYLYSSRIKATDMADMELLKECVVETEVALSRLASFSPKRDRVRPSSPQSKKSSLREDSATVELPPSLAQFDPNPASAPYVTSLDLDSLPTGRQSLLRLSLGESSLSEHMSIPIMVIKGALPGGKVVGITSAVHGNELNGIPLIHRLFREIDCSKLCGTVIAVPVVNVHGYVRHQRGFSDNVDLNRIMPGKVDGSASQRFAFQLGVKLLCKFDYHIDLHTASFGRVNSLYVRCDMNHDMTRTMANLQNPQIIVHSTSPDGSLRAFCMGLNIPSVTVEIGDPSRFHLRFIKSALLGVENILGFLNMYPFPNVPHEILPVLCSHSKWIYAGRGGVLYVHPDIDVWVRQGELIAEVTDIFGNFIERIFADEDSVVVGKSVNPVCQSGDRVIHLGYVSSTEFSILTRDGHE